MPNDDTYEDSSGTAGSPAPAAPPAGSNVRVPPPVPDTGDGSTGKHAMILVPDYANTASATVSSLSSYLRLGAAHTQQANPSRTDLGEDLAALVRGFTDDTRDRGSGSSADSTSDPDPATIPAGDSPPPTAVAGVTTPNLRQQESSRLHTKGGWRDHSDGNRVTTTRGDKVEVIRGNYKMMVLGRTDDVHNAQGREISGGVLDDAGNDLRNTSQTGLEVLYVWAMDAGVWRWHITNTTGDPALANNPAVVTNTWAYSIDTFTGSSALPVHEMSDTTFTDSQTSSLTVTGHQSITVNAASVAQTTNYGTELSTTASSNGVWSNIRLSNLDMMSINAVASNIAYIDVSSLREEVDIAMALGELKLAAIIAEFKIGPHLDFHVTNHIDLHNGGHLDIHIGPHMDLHTLKSVVADQTFTTDLMYTQISASLNFV